MKPPIEENPLEKNDPLWDVLGRARQPAPPDPWFTQKLMRDLPPQEGAGAVGRGWFSWLSSSTPRLWAPVAASLAVALIALHTLTPTQRPAPADPEELIATTQPAVLSDDPQVDAVLEDLDALVAFEDTTVSLEEPM